MPTFTTLPALAPTAPAPPPTQAGAPFSPTAHRLAPIHSFSVQLNNIECLKALSSVLYELGATPTIIGGSKIICSLRSSEDSTTTIVELLVERQSLTRSIVRFCNITPLSTIAQLSQARHCLVTLRMNLMSA